jgi:hypothetical protein
MLLFASYCPLDFLKSPKLENQDQCDLCFLPEIEDLDSDGEFTACVFQSDNTNALMRRKAVCLAN